MDPYLRGRTIVPTRPWPHPLRTMSRPLMSEIGRTKFTSVAACCAKARSILPRGLGMDDRALHLVKIPFRPDTLVRIARGRGFPLREFDDGYLVHTIMRELWQDSAPAPFELRGNGRRTDAWGYSDRDAIQLRDHAQDFGDPSLLDAIDHGLDAIVSKPMPAFQIGKRVGFQVRVCPVTRLANGRGGRRGREVDSFLAHCWRGSLDVAVSREHVYRQWLAERLTEERSGTMVARLSVDSYKRERLLRRTQPGAKGVRVARTIERPDVRMTGELIVRNSDRFRTTLRRGVGRHRAFGFGMMLLVPPSTAVSTTEVGEHDSWS